MPTQPSAPALSARSPINESFNPGETGERLLNYLIDLALFNVIYSGINVIISLVAAVSGNEIITTVSLWDKLLDYVLFYFVYMIYYFFSEGASGGRSLGKLITRTKAVRLDGSPLSWEDAFMRSFCRIIPFEPFSGLWGTPWHDELSKTRVVKLPPRGKSSCSGSA